MGHSYLFTFKYALVMTIVVNLLSLILALGLNSKIRGKNALRGIYFVPNILGGLVIGYIFSFIFTYILPTIGEVTGIDFLKTSLLGSTKWAWIAIVIVGAWQGIAMNTIIYISGLQTVPEEVYEACMLDGASGWKKFKSITLPLIMPFVTINLDKRRPVTEYRVHFLSDLQQWYEWWTVWFPECECICILYCDRCDITVSDEIPGK